MSPEAGVLPRSDRLRATIALMIATAMQAADATIANVALPQLEQSLGGGIALGAWVMTSYLCASAVMAPLTGWLRRRYGAQHLFPAGVGLFVVASLLCSLAPSAGAIILFRVIQGASGGVIHPLGQAILLDIHPKERHGHMLALWGATIMVGPILGPVLGGLITDLASWRWVFVINLPLGVAAVWGMRGILPRTEATRELAMDGIGVVLLIVGIGALQLCLSRAVGRSWLDSPELIAEAAIVVLALATMVVRTRRTGFRVFQPEVWKDVNFAVAAFYNFVTSGLLFTTIIFLPAIGEGPLGYDATLAGFTIVPRGILMMLVMLMVGRLMDRIGHRIVLASGLTCTVVGLAILSAMRPEHAATGMVIGSTIQAIGAGLLFTPLSTLAFWSLPAATRTDGAGVYSLLRQLGCASGVALMTAVLQQKIHGNLTDLAGHAAAPSPLASAAAVAATFHAYTQCFRIMAVASLAILPGIFLFRRIGPSPAMQEVA